MNKKELLDYCEAREIFVPPDATKPVIEAAIVRAVQHLKKAERVHCFGYWMLEHGPCLVCTLQNDCSLITLGMPADRYLKAVERLENPKIRITERLTNESLDRRNKRSDRRQSPKGC